MIEVMFVGIGTNVCLACCWSCLYDTWNLLNLLLKSTFM